MSIRRILQKKGYSQIIAMGILVMALLIAYGIYYANNVKTDLWNSAVFTIMESTNRAGHMISEKIDAEKSLVKKQKEALQSMASSDTAQIDEVMDLFDSRDYPFALVLNGASYPKNSAYTFPQLPKDIGDDGELLAPYISENTGQRVIALAEKVTFQDGASGALIREIAGNSLSDTFSVTFLRNRGHSYLINQKGDILFRSTTPRGNKTSNNLFTLLGNESANEKTSVDKLANIVASGNSGWSVLSYHGQNNLYYFSPIGSTNWYLVSVVAEDVLSEQTEHILAQTFILVGIILLGFLALIGLLIYREHRNLKLLEKENTSEKQMLIESNSEVKTIILGVDSESNTYKVLASAPGEARVPGAKGTFSALVSAFAAEIDAPYREEYRKRFSIPHLKELAAQHKNEYFEFTVSRNGKQHWIGADAVAVHLGNQGSRIVYSERIIDEAKKEEAEKRRMMQNALDMAEQANHAKTTFLNSMSHDIRTPMNAIIGFTALASTHIEDTALVKDYLQKISTSGNHLLALINDVLDMSRIESGSMKLEEEPVHLPELFQDLQTIVQPEVEAKEMHFLLDIDSLTHESVMCDKLHFNQIMLNLLSNALKYTPAGGTIQVRALQKPFVRPNYACYEFHVKDNGIGMSEEFKTHVFETFTREQTQTVSGIQGTGLGMAITKHIVDMMGGTISVHSQEGMGSEFIVTLQFKICKDQDERETKEPVADAKTDFQLKGRKILLAEDNELNREIVVAILEDAGIQVTSVKDGIEAVEAIAKAAPGAYDLILMDIQMPLMDGYTATKEIRTMKNPDIANIPIIALTANAFDSDKKEALQAGMNGYVAKPISIEKLMEVMQEVLR